MIRAQSNSRSFSAVNQFHSGTAVGDAVTNDMFEIQRTFRQAGVRSDIYASHIASGLEGKIKPLHRYAGDRSALLIVHHSMGFDEFDQVVRLPDRKLLRYHNITPPEMLSNSHAKVYAAKGRQQLAHYREHVELGLGDSDYNRRELVELGYRYTAVIPILFQPDALGDEKSDKAVEGNLRGTLNLLFVGRVTPNKRQLDLVRIFDAYLRTYDPNARLWLVGSWDGSEEYRDEILAEISDLGLDKSVSLTGKISALQLATYYRFSQVLLCASEHEGFCVPLLEAMAFDLPVVAFASAAIPETLASAGVLLDSKEPELWCEVIEELRHNQSFRSEILSRQRARLDEFSLEKTGARLLDVIHGLSLGSTIATDRPTLQIQGPFETSYSLAGVNRNLALAMDQQNQFDTSIYCTEGPGDYTPNDADLADKPAAKWLWQKSKMMSEAPQLTIRNLYPPRVDDVNGDVNFLYFFWEDSLVPTDCVDKFNRHLTAVLAPSQYVKAVLFDSGLTIPCHVTGVGVNERFFDKAPHTVRKRDHQTFTFLNIGSAFPRKGIDVLLEAYLTEFTASDNVRLTLKTFPNPHNEVAAQVEAWRKKCPNAPPIIHIDRDFSTADIDELYSEADCVVYPSRAEGFGLPVAEAMACRIPVIVTNYSGLVDFCSDQTAFLVDYDLVPSLSHLATPGSLWAQPRTDQLRERMRFAFANRNSESVTRRVEAAYRNVTENLRWSRVAQRVQEFITDATTSAAPKLAMVTTWDCRCGIAEYSRYLIDALIRGEHKVDIEVLSSPGDSIWPENGIINTVCWDQRPSTDLSRLRAQVLDNGFDIVHFQFNFGFFDLLALAAVIRDLQRAGKKVVITFHSTADVPDPHGTISLGTIAESLRTVDVILVHSSEDERTLAAFGVHDNVRILPHGNLVYPLEDRALRKQLRIPFDPVISTFGFLLPHKGILELLEAVKLLRNDFPDLGLMAQCALHRDGISRTFEQVVRQRILDLGLGQCVLLSTEFVAPEEAMLFLQLSDLVALPYKDTRESSSASVRFALGSGRPVITTNNPIFVDVRESTIQVESCRPKELATAIRTVLVDHSLGEALAAKARAFAESTSWARVSKYYLDLLDPFRAKLSEGVLFPRESDTDLTPTGR
jgi:glycosyltransferase involved in cell wall biosynthesis